MGQPEKSEVDPSPGTITLKPVGVVRNQSREPNWGEKLGAMDWHTRAAEMDKQRKSVSELVIDDKLDGILDGIEEFSHIVVLYWAHRVPPERRSVYTGHPMGNPKFPWVGVFATNSPIRPNSILMTVVRLLKREGNILRVTGLDALDNSPILDIKPYSSESEIEEIKTPEWMKRINQEFIGESP